MLFILSYKNNFCFLNIITYIFNNLSAIKMTIKELQDFIFEDFIYFQRMQFAKGNKLFNERSEQKVIYNCLHLN